MACIFFVDDDPVTLQILGKAAELLGHKPTLIDSATQALEQVIRQKPDLIMMDMMMPDMDGLTMLSHLRQLPDLAQVPVVILSAGAAMDDRERVLAAGAQAYITKPVSLNVLLETIKRYASC